jgi:SAM-dependent methyltransferase
MKIDDQLSCPACKSNLISHLDSFVCANKTCFHGDIDKAFSCINKIPILISETECDTVFSFSHLNSLVERSGDGGLFKSLKQHIVGKSKTTVLNISNFLRHLKKTNKNPLILIIGAGELGSGTDEIYSSDAKLVGTDIYINPNIDYLADAHYLPFRDNVFDGVLIQAVLEHVADPQVVVSEIYRVLKTNGLVYAETPFMQQVHEGAYDFTRFTVVGHRYLFKRFDRIDAGGLDGVGVVLAWSIRAFVHGITRSRLIAKLFFIPLKYILTFVEKFASPASLYDANSGSYFLGKKSNNTMSHKDAINEYDGCDR